MQCIPRCSCVCLAQSKDRQVAASRQGSCIFLGGPGETMTEGSIRGNSVPFHSYCQCASLHQDIVPQPTLALNLPCCNSILSFCLRSLPYSTVLHAEVSCGRSRASGGGSYLKIHLRSYLPVRPVTRPLLLLDTAQRLLLYSTKILSIVRDPGFQSDGIKRANNLTTRASIIETLNGAFVPGKCLQTILPARIAIRGGY